MAGIHKVRCNVNAKFAITMNTSFVPGIFFLNSITSGVSLHYP